MFFGLCVWWRWWCCFFSVFLLLSFKRFFVMFILRLFSTLVSFALVRLLVCSQIIPIFVFFIEVMPRKRACVCVRCVREGKGHKTIHTHKSTNCTRKYNTHGNKIKCPCINCESVCSLISRSLSLLHLHLAYLHILYIVRTQHTGTQAHIHAYILEQPHVP